MSDFLHPITSLPTPFNMVVLIVLIATVGGVLKTMLKQLGTFAHQRQDLVFKRELIDRGMSAEEVQRVVEARSKPAPEKGAAVYGNQYFTSEK